MTGDRDWKQKGGRIRRRKPITSVEGISSDRTVCDSCRTEDQGRYIMKAYYMQDGRIDPAFLQCPNCRIVLSKEILMHERVPNSPLGYVKPAKPTFEVGSKRRTHRSRGLEPTEDPVPPIGNRPDKDLQVLLDRGILVNLQDSDQIDEDNDVDEDEEQGDPVITKYE